RRLPIVSIRFTAALRSCCFRDRRAGPTLREVAARCQLETIGAGGRARLPLFVLAGVLGLGCVERRPLQAGAGSGSLVPDGAPAGEDGGAAHPPTQPPCAPDLPPRLALAAVLGTDLMFVMSDGTSRSVYSFDPYAPAGALSFAARVV